MLQVVGASISETYMRLCAMEKASKMTLGALQTGAPLSNITKMVCVLLRAVLTDVTRRTPDGSLFQQHHEDGVYLAPCSADYILECARFSGKLRRAL